jgi:predicted nuclease of predicted toxin-antitoxin system
VTFAVLLDENLPRSVAAGLRADGHNVVSISEQVPSSSDGGVLALARAADRWLVTFDSDFGDLIFQRRAPPPPAVLYLRMHPIVASEALAWTRRGLLPENAGHFCVITREGVRRRRFP